MTEEIVGDPGSTARPRRKRRLRSVLIGLVTLAVIAGVVVYFNRERLTTPEEGCTFQTSAGTTTLELDKAANAATITAVGVSRGLPERAMEIALATALQESKLRNLAGGDRDSLGLFQQRPSQGWGTAQQIADPVYATNKFFDGLVKIQGYAKMPLTDAAQQVQKSGYPQAYAKHETDAMVIASSLDGREPAALNCVIHNLSGPVGDSSAGTEPAAQLGPKVQREFGRTVTVAAAQSPSKDARPILALTPQPTATADTGPGAQQQAGWAVAQWAVAQASYLDIGAVSYGGKVWRQDKPRDGWKADPSAASTDRVLVTLGAAAKK